MRLKNLNRTILLLWLILSLLVMTGCKKDSVTSAVREVKGYSLPQIMLVVATERNQYEVAYSNQIWTVPMEAGQTSPKEYLFDRVKQYLADIKILNLMADENKLTLTGEEQDKIRRLSDEFYKSLTDQDISYTRVKAADVKSLYEEICRAEKMVDELTKDMVFEVSDDDAKVITLDWIRMDHAETAAQVLEKVRAEGADFTMIAKSHSLDLEIRKNLGRGKLSLELEQAAFALAVDQISEIVSDGTSYYILKCVSDYDAEATKARKEKIYAQKKNSVFHQIYDTFAEKNQIVFEEGIWEKITFSEADHTTTVDFFKLYQNYFSN